MREETEPSRGGAGHTGSPGGGAGAPDARAWRSLLFVPGSRTERYVKALAAGADLVCVDLEDAVAPAGKANARRSVIDLVGGADWRPERSTVRVNHPSTPAGAADLEALADLAEASDPGATLTIVVPKVDAPGGVAAVREPLETAGWRVHVVAMIETARGLEHAQAIAGAPGVVALFLGGVDLAADLGCALTWDALLYARGRLVHAAALAGGPALLDVPFLELDDVDALERETRAVAELGFTGKSAIHPRQIAPIHRALAPSRPEVERAQRLLEAYDRGGGGVISFEGIMVDRPVVEAARRVLWRASRTGTGAEQAE